MPDLNELTAAEFARLLDRISAIQERESSMPSNSYYCTCVDDCHGGCCCGCTYCHGTDADEFSEFTPELTTAGTIDRSGPRPRLQSYSYRPTIRFHGDSLLQLGMECELSSETTWPIARARHILGDLACYKSDGSVDGFEMVTQPMDYQYWQTEFPWEVFSALAEEGCTVQPHTNGIHVHLSRRGFSSPAHVYRWMKLLYRNSEMVERIARRRGTSWAPFDDHHRAGQFQHVYKKPRRIPRQPETVAISTMSETAYQERTRYGRIRRDDNAPRAPEYVAAILDMSQQSGPYSLDLERRITPDVVADYGGRMWAYLPAVDRYIRVTELNDLARVGANVIAESRDYLSAYQQSLPEYEANSDPTQHTRYAAINTTNSDTYEIRLFASTVNPHEARTAIQFCAASVEYTRNLSAHQVVSGGWTWDSFKAWVQAPETAYPDLARALDARINWTRAAYVYGMSHATSTVR